MLGPAAELTYDDAPWMSAAIRSRPEGRSVKFAHSTVTPDLAERCGARSLRYLLLLEEKLTDLAGPSLLSVRLLFDSEGAELLEEARELALSLGVPAATELLGNVAQCLVETPLADLPDLLQPSVQDRPTVLDGVRCVATQILDLALRMHHKLMR